MLWSTQLELAFIKGKGLSFRNFHLRRGGLDFPHSTVCFSREELTLIESNQQIYGFCKRIIYKAKALWRHCFHLEKMLISLFSLLRKDTKKWYFRIMEMSENPQKCRLFAYFHVCTPCEKMWFCAVTKGLQTDFSRTLLKRQCSGVLWIQSNMYDKFFKQIQVTTFSFYLFLQKTPWCLTEFQIYSIK